MQKFMQNEKKIKFEIKSALFRCFWAVILEKKNNCYICQNANYCAFDKV